MVHWANKSSHNRSRDRLANLYYKPFEERNEVRKREQVPVCAINEKPTIASFVDKVSFQKGWDDATEA